MSQALLLSSSMKKALEIQVMGQKLQIRSDSNDAYVSRVASFVDKKVAEVIQSTKSVASLNVAILAAMNITDEYLKYREDNEERFKSLEKKIQDLIELIDVQL